MESRERFAPTFLVLSLHVQRVINEKRFDSPTMLPLLTVFFFFTQILSIREEQRRFRVLLISLFIH